MQVFNEVDTRFVVYGHSVAISHLFNTIVVDGKSYRLKCYTPWTIKVQKTQVQCQDAERLYKFLTDPNWKLGVTKVLDALAEGRW